MCRPWPNCLAIPLRSVAGSPTDRSLSRNPKDNPMAQETKIAWTDATFNPWVGCSKVHTGCAHCYAEADMDHRRGRVKWGPHGTRSRTSDTYWLGPLTWNRKAKDEGRRWRVFCCSLADVFEDWTGPVINHKGDRLAFDPRDIDIFRRHRPYPCPSGSFLPPHDFQWTTLSDLRKDLFRLIDQTPHLDWLLLTKRPENVRRMWDYSRKLKTERVSQNEGDNIDPYRPNVQLGTSVSDQPTAEKAVPELLQCRDLCPVLFLSAEPLLGPIEFHWREK